MKKLFAAVLFLLVSLAVLLLFRPAKLDLTAPRFETGDFGQSVTASDQISYEFLTTRPFAGGKMWVKTWSRTNRFQSFLYDIEAKRILGRLLNTDPEFTDSTQSRVLCLTRTSSSNLWQRLKAGIRELARGKIKFGSVEIDTVWIVDLKSGSAEAIGQIVQYRGASTSFEPSPDLRYAFSYGGAFHASGFYLCDLQKRSFRKVKSNEQPVGWCDDTRILLKATNNNFMAYNVVTRKSSILIRSEEIASLLATNAITATPKVDPFTVWNGKQNDVYLTDTHQKWLAAESVLIKVKMPEARLELVSPQFKFEWSDHFHPNGNYYIFSGRQGGQGSSAVFVRDLRTNEERVLVPDDGAKYHSIPNFYNDSVIYVRSNMLWQTDLEGTKQTVLFPPR